MDLPLSANYHDVNVNHFVLNLSCNFDTKQFEGTITLFCRASRNFSQKFYPDSHYHHLYENNRHCNLGFSTTTDSQIPATKDFSGPAIKYAARNSSSINTTTNSDSTSTTATTNTSDSSSTTDFVILDSYALDITRCSFCAITSDDRLKHHIKELSLSTHHLQIPHTCMSVYDDLHRSFENDDNQLIQVNFNVSEHSLKIFLPHALDQDCLFAIKVEYCTQPQGPSLIWTNDQDNRPCVFTVGHLFNNRSLFPSQDLPQAMSTWHCSITLPSIHQELLTAIMTGEKDSEVNVNASGDRILSFYSSYKMPAATFALAVGSWSVTNLLSLSVSEGSSTPQCRLFSPECLHEKSVDQLGRYLPVCFEALHSIFGQFPLKHLDILFVPECFDSLGLSSPHLIFLSQSLLCPDLSMFARLAHELCHTWFGILTGPKDWTEEWLTEGVCCYLEDKIHSSAMKWSDEKSRDRSELRALLKFRLLQSEISNTPENLQILRPNEGRSSSSDDVKDHPTFVRNGLNPEKTLIQVHYLKGFFLLRYLEQYAGKEMFLEALKQFTLGHLGQLFSSNEMLDYFFAHCPNLRGRRKSCQNLERRLIQMYEMEMKIAQSKLENFLKKHCACVGKHPQTAAPFRTSGSTKH